jgi:bifunctional non-homologous end joining protein LigD
MADHLLKKYRQMRDFGDTPEPAGGKPKRGKRPIFVIQKHAASHLHYDFRLEMEGVLKSWAVPKGPSYDPGTKRLAMMTEDHPYDYADFEGVIPEGNYGAGNVIIWDNGTWEFIEPGDDPVKAVKQGKLTFRMFGKKMFGEWALVRIHGRSPKGNEWLLLKHRDEFASETVDVTALAPKSVISNRDVDELGSSDNTWQSNRKASSRRAPTLAARLEAEQDEEKKKKPAVAKKAAAKKRTSSAARPRQSPAKRSRAASSPSRSSRARSPRKAGSTARRRPR